VQGCESRHNLKYWSLGTWLGLGCGAHSTVGSRRWKNVAGTEEYIGRIERGESAATEELLLDEAARLGEALFTGLRLARGVDLVQVSAQFGRDVWALFGRDLEPALQAGLLIRDGASLRLTRRGMLLANEVMAVFV
jgi:oxygen-independent coproporphyrinogen-3 oxidase